MQMQCVVVENSLRISALARSSSDATVDVAATGEITSTVDGERAPAVTVHRY